MRWVVTDVAFGAVWLVLGMIVRLLPVSAPIQETISNVAWTVMFMTLGIGLPVAVTLAVFKYRLYELDVVINKTLLYVGLVGFITAVYVAIVVGIGSLVGSGDQAERAVVDRRDRDRGGCLPSRARARPAFRQPTRLWATRDPVRGALGVLGADRRRLRCRGPPPPDGADPRGGEPARSAATYGSWSAADFDPTRRGPRTSSRSRRAPARTVPRATGRGASSGRAARRALAREASRENRSPRPRVPRRAPRRPGGTRPSQRAADRGAARTSRGAPGIASTVGRGAGRRAAKARAEHPRRGAAAARRAQREDSPGPAARRARPAKVERCSNRSRPTRTTHWRTCEISRVGSTRRSWPTRASSQRSRPRPARPRSRRPSTATASDGSAKTSRPPSTSAASRRCRTSPSTRRPTRATIALSNGDGTLRFTVTDDGAGFDPASTGYGTGLQGIADRLAALDGTLTMRSEPGAGTILEGRVPIAATGGST